MITSAVDTSAMSPAKIMFFPPPAVSLAWPSSTCKASRSPAWARPPSPHVAGYELLALLLDALQQVVAGRAHRRRGVALQRRRECLDTHADFGEALEHVGRVAAVVGNTYEGS